MKLCCCSRSYAHAFHSGDLTQLEWIDRCAELGLDGVDLAASHFPRTDFDYLAQLKKLCVDRGLTIAAMSLDDAFGGGDDIDAQAARFASWVAHAADLGAPLVRFSVDAATGSPGIAWRELIRGLKHVSAVAKERNVTLALQMRSGSQVASPADGKRALKEADSAWLRCTITLNELEPSSMEAWYPLLDQAVIVVANEGGSPASALGELNSARFIGFVSLDAPLADPQQNEAALADLRAKLTAALV